MLVGHPLDTLKVKLQVCAYDKPLTKCDHHMRQPSPQVGQATSLSNLVVKCTHPFLPLLFHCNTHTNLYLMFLAVARDEGLRGFYRGFAPPLLLTGFVNTVRKCYSRSKRFLLLPSVVFIRCTSMYVPVFVHYAFRCFGGRSSPSWM